MTDLRYHPRAKAQSLVADSLREHDIWDIQTDLESDEDASYLFGMWEFLAGAPCKPRTYYCEEALRLYKMGYEDAKAIISQRN